MTHRGRQRPTRQDRRDMKKHHRQQKTSYQDRTEPFQVITSGIKQFSSDIDKLDIHIYSK